MTDQQTTWAEAFYFAINSFRNTWVCTLTPTWLVYFHINQEFLMDYEFLKFCNHQHNVFIPTFVLLPYLKTCLTLYLMSLSSNLRNVYSKLALPAARYRVLNPQKMQSDCINSLKCLTTTTRLGGHIMGKTERLYPILRHDLHASKKDRVLILWSLLSCSGSGL